MPFFKASIKRYVGSGINRADLKQVIKQHYAKSVLYATKKQLSESLVDGLGLSKKEALAVEKAVHKEFDTISRKAIEQRLNQLLGGGKKRVASKKRMDKIIESLNLGALDQ